MVFDRSSKPPFGLLEIKCPYSPFVKSLTMAEAVATEKNFYLVADGKNTVMHV